jgi:hypothetical protein
MLDGPIISAWSYTREEAEGFLRMIQGLVGRLSDAVYKNVYHYLVGDYEAVHYQSMFGGPDHFARDGIGYFWENILEGHRSPALHYDNVRFANNDGPNFRDYRDTALRMFREQFPPRPKQRRRR